jgi:hypothetical protein
MDSLLALILSQTNNQSTTTTTSVASSTTTTTTSMNQFFTSATTTTTYPVIRVKTNEVDESGMVTAVGDSKKGINKRNRSSRIVRQDHDHVDDSDSDNDDGGSMTRMKKNKKDPFTINDKLRVNAKRLSRTNTTNALVAHNDNNNNYNNNSLGSKRSIRGTDSMKSKDHLTHLQSNNDYSSNSDDNGDDGEGDNRAVNNSHIESSKHRSSSSSSSRTKLVESNTMSGISKETRLNRLKSNSSRDKHHNIDVSTIISHEVGDHGDDVDDNDYNKDGEDDNSDDDDDEKDDDDDNDEEDGENYVILTVTRSGRTVKPIKPIQQSNQTTKALAFSNPKPKTFVKKAQKSSIGANNKNISAVPVARREKQTLKAISITNDNIVVDKKSIGTSISCTNVGIGGSSSSSSSGSNDVWKPPEIIALYAIHAKVDSTRSDFWEQVSMELNNRGVLRSKEECQQRWFLVR